MGLLYTTPSYLIQPLVWLRLLLCSREASAYRKRWAERCGFCQNKVEPDGILLHSVSAGETLAAIPLVRAPRHHYPLIPITVTTAAPTSSERTMSTFDKDVHHVYLPYDLPGTMNRFLGTVRPKLAIVMEAKLWPNIMAVLHKRKIPPVIVSARLPERSARGCVELGGFMRRLSGRITLIVTQNEEGGNRFLVLGLKRNQLTIAGSLKFDISVTPEPAAHTITLCRQWASHRKAWIATSVYDSEERVILQAHKELLGTFPDPLLILVPRHSEHFLDAREMVQKARMSFTLCSTDETPSFSTQVMTSDTMGELTLLYGIADLAFIGDSLVERGGHDPLEPAAHTTPMLVGPHTFNFKDICVKLQQDDGLVTITDADSLVREVPTPLTDEDYRLWYGRYTVEALYQNQDALLRLLRLL